MTLAPRTSETSRREFLRTAVLAAGPAAFGLARASAADEDTPSFVDAHVHVWTPDVERYPLAAGYTPADVAPKSFTPEELFAQCRPHGVGRVVLIQMSFYGFDTRYMLDAIAAHPGIFRGVAVVDGTRPGVCDEMRRLAGLGIRGFRLYTDKAKAEAWLDSRSMQAIWAFAADEGLAMCLLADPEALPAVDRMCERFPKTRVVIDHFARIGMRGPAKQEDLDNLSRIARFEHAFVKTSAFYALGEKRAPYTDLGPLVRRLREAYGAERLMWASDCPFQVQEGHTYADSINLIRERLEFLAPEDKEWMLRKTAEKVFFT